MSEELRIELTPEERDDCLGTVAIVFMRHRGRVIITEQWSAHDESWGDHCSVTIPARVWALGIEWLAATTGDGQ